MEPILAIWDGHYLDNTTLSEADLQCYVQDALNELEYIMGPINSTYGALRASHGHPKGWDIKFIEIGNEDMLSEGLPTYRAYRFHDFHTAISKAYPNITIMASTPQIALPPGVIGDFQEYSTPDTFVSQFGSFDHNTSKTLIGEYAVVAYNGAEDDPYGPLRLLFPSWIGAVGEAVFEIGTERASLNVFGDAYAPILQNLNNFQWTPDLIPFTADPTQTVKSTNYHQNSLFSNTRMTTNHNASTTSNFGPAYWVAGENIHTKTHILKAAVYNSTAEVPFTVAFEGLEAGATGSLTVLTAPSPESSSHIGSDMVITTHVAVTAGSNGFVFTLPDLSVTLLKAEA